MVVPTSTERSPHLLQEAFRWVGFGRNFGFRAPGREFKIQVLGGEC